MDITQSSDPRDLFSATGLTIVISGGGSGIGLAFASALVKNGAEKVFLMGRRLGLLNKAAKDIGGNIVPIQCDVTNKNSLAKAVETISSQTKHIDVLINNAGVIGPNHTDINKAETIQQVSDLMLSDLEAWPTTFAVNSTAIVTVSASFLSLLNEGNLRRGWPDGKAEARSRDTVPAGIDANDERSSQIITVASIASFNREVTAGLAYTASKAGAMMLGKSMAYFLAPWGIRSNIIAPGRFPSEMTAGGKTVFPVAEVPHGTPGRYENMAACILNLVGKGGAYYNGAVEVIDGGRLSMMAATF